MTIDGRTVALYPGARGLARVLSAEIGDRFVLIGRVHAV
jgi:hypothetical protein